MLVKLGRRASQPVIGRLVKSPKKGDVVVIEFQDGLHEYVTTPVERVLTMDGGSVQYIQTVNSRYRMELRPAAVRVLDSSLAQ